MTNAITTPTNAQAAGLQGSTPVSQPAPSSASPISSASHQRINRSPNPVLSNLPRPSQNAALAPPVEPAIKTSLSALPGPFLIGTLHYCNGPAADKAVTLSKKFKNLTIASRKQTVLAIAKQPGRVTQEKLPTLLELWRMGIPDPHLNNILHTMKSELSGQPGEDGVITRDTKAHAVLQQTQRVFGQAGGLAQRVVNEQYTDMGQVNAQGQTHGFGIRTWQNEPGKKYIGSFRNGQMDGFGYKEFPNGTRGEGMFVRNQLHGQGKLFRANGDSFEGTFVDDRPHGTGMEIKVNGDRFEETYVDGRRHGPSRQFFANGSRFEGTHVDGLLQGRATIFDPDGEQTECNFVNDQFHGPYIKTWPNGEQRTTHYDMGRLVD
jgi:hypothetical protein